MVYEDSEDVHVLHDAVLNAVSMVRVAVVNNFDVKKISIKWMKIGINFYPYSNVVSFLDEIVLNCPKTRCNKKCFVNGKV